MAGKRMKERSLRLDRTVLDWPGVEICIKSFAHIEDDPHSYWYESAPSWYLHVILCTEHRTVETSIWNFDEFLAALRHAQRTIETRNPLSTPEAELSELLYGPSAGSPQLWLKSTRSGSRVEFIADGIVWPLELYQLWDIIEILKDVPDTAADMVEALESEIGALKAEVGPHDKVYLDKREVKVTSNQVEIEGKAYSLEQIESVEMDSKNPSPAVPIVLGLLGILPILLGLSLILRGSPSGYVALPLVVGMAIVAFAFFARKEQKTIYTVHLFTPSAEIEVLKTIDRRRVGEVIAAIEEAMAES
jgi:hypothetical protein